MPPGQSRRRFLARATGLGLAPATLTTNAGATDPDPPPDADNRVWGQHDTGELPRDPFPDHQHHLGSSLSQTEADPGGNHEFRVAGAFAVANIDDALPPQSAGSIHSQTVRIVNQTPNTLAVATSPNPHEVAFAPKLVHVNPEDWLQRFG